MKTEISSITLLRLRRAVPIIVIAVLALSMAGDAVGQKLKGGTLANSTIRSFGLSKREVKPLLPVIQTHTDGLMKIFSKYEDKIENGAVFLSISSEIWNDLRNLRRRNASNVNRAFTPKQSAALRSFYTDMEKETVTMLLDEELQIWGDDLDLTNPQMDELYKIAMRDISRKQLLLNGLSTGAAFETKLKAITVETESRIMKVLFPDQLDAWEELRRKIDADRAGLIA